MSRHLLLILAVLVLAACADGPRIQGEAELSQRVLLAAARRPIEAWRNHGHRPADLADAADTIRDQLTRLGYHHAEVTFAVVEDEPAFTIRQGPRVRTGELALPGRQALPGQEALPAAELEPFLAPLHPWYVHRTAQDVVGKIEQHYRSAGWLEAVVDGPHLNWSTDKSTVAVTLNLHQGPRYRVADAVVDGAPPETREPLTALVEKSRDWHQPFRATETATRLRAWLYDHGWAAAQVTVAETIDNDAAEVHLRYRVVSGPRHLLRSLRIEGQERTATSFLQRSFATMEPGAPLDRSQLDAGVSKLHATGLFDRVTTTVNAEPSPRGDVPAEVVVGVREAADRRVDLGLGWGSYERLRGLVGYTDDNVFGHGLRLAIGLHGSLKGWGVTTGIADQHYVGPGRTAALDGAYFERQQPSYSHQEYSLTPSLLQRFAVPGDEARWDARTSLAFSLAKDFAISGAIADAEAEGLYRTSVLGLRVRRDSRTPFVTDPDGGSLTVGQLAWGAKPLGSQFPYLETGLEWSYHHRLANWLVGSLRLGYSTRDSLEGTTLPIGERLFLGGEDSVRSFTQDQLGPADATGTPVGGLSRGLGNLEFHVRPFSEWEAVEFAAFYDLGALGQQAYQLDGPWGHAVGGGLRYVLPVGPIRVDWAYNPGERFAANAPWALHFTVGFAF